MNEKEKLYTIHEATTLFNLGPQQLRFWISAGYIKVAFPNDGRRGKKPYRLTVHDMQKIYLFAELTEQAGLSRDIAGLLVESAGESVHQKSIRQCCFSKDGKRRLLEIRAYLPTPEEIGLK
ncbi:MAG: hypothetical protein FVQ81_01975 [Candidatus Glassbacteria bacterium]|nr:hypothetical protein [Candidatus Glassbacteria bacterium]